MKFHFKAEDNGIEYSMKYECDKWDEIVYQLPQFFRGCGYFVDDGDITVQKTLKSFSDFWGFDDSYVDDPKEEKEQQDDKQFTDSDKG